MKKIVALFAVLLLVLPCFVGCGGSSTTTVTLLNWGEYLEPTLIARFEEENPGIKVVQRTMTSNEEMYTVCATEGSAIDIVVPSDYMVERLVAEDLAAELDLSNIPNFQYVEEVSKGRTFDPNSTYSVPYMMGTLGIVYNTKLVDDPVDSWDILWNEKYKGQILMYNSIRDSLAVALSRLGYSINTRNPAELEEAGQLLLEQKPLVLAYLTDEIKDSMKAGTAALAVDYSGAAADAISENPDLNYVVPKEGGNIWVDNLLILKSSKNKEAAERFINFLLDPEIMAINAEYIGYTPPSDAAMELISEEYLENPAFVIKPEDAARLEYFEDLGEDIQLYNDVWMKVVTSG